MLLEHHTQLKLNVSFASWLGTGDFPEVPVLLIRVQIIGPVLRSVGDIRSFGAELQFPSFSESEVFEDGEIQRPSWGSDVALQPDITLGQALSWCRHYGYTATDNRGQKGKVRRIEILSWGATSGGRIVGTA